MQFRRARNKVKWQFLVLHPVSRYVLLKFSYIYIVNTKSYLIDCPHIFVEKKRIVILKTYKHNRLEMWQCTDSSFIIVNVIHSKLITHRKTVLKTTNKGTNKFFPFRNFYWKKGIVKESFTDFSEREFSVKICSVPTWRGTAVPAGHLQ